MPLPPARSPRTAEEEEEEDPALRLRVRVGELTPAVRVDGILDEAEWQTVPDSIGNLTTIEPVQGGVPNGATVVKALVSSRELVIGIRCYDPDPTGIVSFSKARDSDLATEDHVVVVLDTYQDDRSGYVFAVNPAGARFDGLVIERGEDVNSNWDTIWEAKTSRDELGWSAEIRIPIQSLGFEDALDSWGFNVQRRVQRLQETSRWSSPDLDTEIYQTSGSGLLTALPEFDLGAGLSIRPALVGVADRPSRDRETDFDGDVSLDMTKRIGPSFLSSLTVNTDFAETEVDVRQINLTRFDPFFPEKRSFFLEGADIFEFGLGLDEESLLPFFSRRIGLVGPAEDDLTPVPINAGIKINGRAGDASLGALAVGTRQRNNLVIGDEGQTLDVPQGAMGAFRLKHDLFEESVFGMLFTFGDQLGRDDAVTGGMDLTLQTSNFMNEKNLLFGAWGLFNDRRGLTRRQDGVRLPGRVSERPARRLAELDAHRRRLRPVTRLRSAQRRPPVEVLVGDQPAPAAAVDPPDVPRSFAVLVQRPEERSLAVLRSADQAARLAVRIRRSDLRAERAVRRPPAGRVRAGCGRGPSAWVLRVDTLWLRSAHRGEAADLGRSAVRHRQLL